MVYQTIWVLIFRNPDVTFTPVQPYTANRNIPSVPSVLRRFRLPQSCRFSGSGCSHTASAVLHPGSESPQSAASHSGPEWHWKPEKRLPDPGRRWLHPPEVREIVSAGFWQWICAAFPRRKVLSHSLRTDNPPHALQSVPTAPSVFLKLPEHYLVISSNSFLIRSRCSGSVKSFFAVIAKAFTKLRQLSIAGP